jgi:hypothetical protein
MFVNIVFGEKKQIDKKNNERYCADNKEKCTVHLGIFYGAKITN